MLTNPLHHPCPHAGTPQEQQRDPNYLGCNAQPGEPCHWATRHDGIPDPAFHSERLELAVTRPARPDSALSPQDFDAAVLRSGLV